MPGQYKDSQEKYEDIRRALNQWKQDCQDVIDLGKEFYTHERLQLEAKNITRIDEILKGEV